MNTGKSFNQAAWDRIKNATDSGRRLTDRKEQGFAEDCRSEHGILYLKNSHSRSTAQDRVVLSAESWVESGKGIVRYCRMQNPGNSSASILQILTTQLYVGKNEGALPHATLHELVNDRFSADGITMDQAAKMDTQTAKWQR